MSKINPDPFTTRPEIEGTFGVVTSTHWIATAVGMGILEKGGNAFDAGVATAFTLQVAGSVGPNSDNSANLGSAFLRWNTVFAANGTINTSDARTDRLRAWYRAYRAEHGRKPIEYKHRERWTELPREFRNRR